MRQGINFQQVLTRGNGGRTMRFDPRYAPLRVRADARCPPRGRGRAGMAAA